MPQDVPLLSEAEQAQFFDDSIAASRDAMTEESSLTRVISVGGVYIKIIFANEKIHDFLMPAIQHLHVTEKVNSSVEFYLWDSKTTSCDMPSPPCSRKNFTHRGDIWGMSSERYLAAFHWSDFSVNLYDSHSKIGIYWVRDIEEVPYWSLASPMRSLFYWALRDYGLQLMHAAAIGTDEGVAVITGRGGVGKSTTALSCLSNGMKYIGDDYIVVGSEPEPRAYSLYSTAKLNADQSDKFPQLRKHILNQSQLEKEKAAYYLHPDNQDVMAAELPVKCVLTPVWSGDDSTKITGVNKDHLLSAATFTTMSQLPYSGQRTHDCIKTFIEKCPLGEIHLGKDLDAVVETIREVTSGGTSQLLPSFSNSNMSESTSRPLISVIIPVYNGAKFLPSAIDSVLAQKYPAIEIFVIDDGSTDDISEVVARLPVDVRYYRRENEGPAAARNFGIKDAGGDLIAFLDVDDLWPANMLSMLVDYFLDEPNLEIVKGHAQLLKKDPSTGEYSYTGNPAESFPSYIGSAVYRRSVFRSVGLFDESLRFGEDTDWFDRAKEQNTKIMCLNAVTLQVRRHGDNMTAKATDLELRSLARIKKAMDRYRNKSNG